MLCNANFVWLEGNKGGLLKDVIFLLLDFYFIIKNTEKDTMGTKIRVGRIIPLCEQRLIKKKYILINYHT
ncbi:MAG: hypothetical protein A2X12_08125 [Bacteroidetes bacterium GWE2_29_8]|nr:MAG: hypothetical protein A2X12_08125 [Bacteroidetes bacterium GWE2_29_8]OFY17512.1 MAG: hypothetical protein A2X02_05685 [Bacteroidetes bacterium GWF2_29_10]